MSKRALEVALKAYPIQGEWVGNQYGEWDEDKNQELRKAFQQGYEQSEKDTIERVCDWLKKNVTYIHPRTNKETCIVNLNALREAMEGE